MPLSARAYKWIPVTLLVKGNHAVDSHKTKQGEGGGGGGEGMLLIA